MSNLLSQASLVMIPSGYKEDIVYSVIPTSGAGDLTFTRASNGTRVNSAGLVEVAPWNLLSYSEDFTNAAWTKVSTTITANNTTAPNGTNTATKFESVASGVPQLSQALTGTNTISIYAKAGNISNFRIWIGSEVIFDLSTGTVTAGTATMENVGNGWYRCIISATTAGAFNPYFVASASGQFVYIWGAQVNIGSTAKPYFPTTDRLNVPRLTYQNGGGGCPSLLLEKQSTNLLTYSEEFDNANWTKAQGNGGTLPIITANYGISPDGTQNADRIQLTRTTQTSSFSYVYQTYIGTIGVSYTWSIWLKSLSGTPSIALSYDGSNYVNIVTLTTEWQRYTFTSNAINTSIQATFLLFQNLSGTSLSADFLAWGFQLEASSYPTSYIPTTSSSATRVADACFKTGIGSLFGTNKGTFFWQGVTPYFVSGAAQYLWDISDTINYNLNRFGLYMVATNTVQLYTSVTGGNNATLAQNSFAKIALVWNGTSCSLYINGAVAITQTISNSNPTAIHLNTRYSLNENGNTEVGEVVVFNTNLTNAELIALTTL